MVEASGAVILASDGARCIAIDPHRDLPPGVVVDTGVGGRITLMRGAESIVVSPRSRLTLLPEQGQETRVAQHAGMAWFKIAKKDTPHFSVQTPELTATVRGTTFTVAIDAAGAAVHVREGAVEVATGWRDAVTLVKAGTMARVQRAAPDRIALMNGGNVLRTVTGYDRGRAPAGSLRLGASGGVGALFAAAPRHARLTATRAPARSTAAHALVAERPDAAIESAERIGGTADRPAGGPDGALRLSDASWTSRDVVPSTEHGGRGLAAVPVERAATKAVRAPAVSSAPVSQDNGYVPAPRRRPGRMLLDLPVWETTLGAFLLLILIVAHTFFGAGRRAKAARADEQR